MAAARRLADVDRETTPARITTRLCLDGGLRDRVQALADQMAEAAREPDSDRLREAAEAIEAERAKAKLTTFVFERLDPEAWSDLLAEHENENEHSAGARDLFADSIRPAAVKASMVDPEPDHSFDTFWRKLNHGQQQQLYDAAWAVNADPVDIPFVRAASLLARASRRSSTTAADTASQDPSSSAGAESSGPATSTTTTGALSRP
jgi:hypothetical protein